MKDKKVISKKKVVKAKIIAKTAVKKGKKVVKKVIRAYTFKPLMKALKVLGIKGSALARAIPVSHSYVSSWLYEINTVPLKHAFRIEELTEGKVMAKALNPEAYKVYAKQLKVKAKTNG